VSNITSKIHTTSAKDRGERKERERQKRQKAKQKRKKERERKEKRKRERSKGKKSTLYQLTRVTVQLLGLLWQSAF